VACQYGKAMGAQRCTRDVSITVRQQCRAASVWPAGADHSGEPHGDGKCPQWYRSLLTSVHHAPACGTIRCAMAPRRFSAIPQAGASAGSQAVARSCELAPVFTQRIDPQSETRRPGGEAFDCPTRHDEGGLSHPLSVITAMSLLSHFTMNYLDMGYFAAPPTRGVRAVSPATRTTCQRDIPR
jgi:hypothetical protein